MSRSRTALSVVLERYEIEALISYHRDEETRRADRREYLEANSARNRVEELEQILKTPLPGPDHG